MGDGYPAGCKPWASPLAAATPFQAHDDGAAETAGPDQEGAKSTTTNTGPPSAGTATAEGAGHPRRSDPRPRLKSTEGEVVEVRNDGSGSS